MKKDFLGACTKIRLLMLASLLSAPIVRGQVTPSAIESLKQEMEQLRQRMSEVEKKIKELESEKTPSSILPTRATNAPAATPVPTSPLAPATPTTTQPWSASQPIALGRAGSAYMNISFDALMNFGWSTASDPSEQLNLGDHDPTQRGFSLRNAEISLDGAVDPYFKGFANIVFKLDNQNATDVELEEVFLQSTSLPANLQLKGGQFFGNFGRQNSQHPHQWGFVDQPLILNRAFGPDGLRNIGAQISWLTPTPFYSELFLGILNGQSQQAFSFRNLGETDSTGTRRVHGRTTLDRGLRGPGDLLFVPRYATSFDLTDTQTLVLGASAAVGPNDTGAHTRTQIYGLDAYWKWKPVNAREGFPFVSWQTEALYRRFETGADPLAPTQLSNETLRDWGFYSQILWGIKPRWVAGLRGEFVTGNDGAFDAEDIFRGDRTRLSPNLTWYPSEFSKIRLQYNYDRGQLFDDGHSVWLQMEFLLGAHGAHKF